MIWRMFPGLDLCYADPAQPVTTEGEDLDDLSDLSVDDLSVRRVQGFDVDTAVPHLHFLLGFRFLILFFKSNFIF